MRRAAIVLAALALQACAVHHYPLPDSPRAATPLTEEAQSRFDYAVVNTATLVAKWRDDEVEISDGVMTVRVHPKDLDGEPEEIEIEFEYWRNLEVGDAPAPTMILTPILGGGKNLARTSCRDFMRSGMHVILAWRGTKILRSSWPVDWVETFTRRGVGARRALLDWAETRPEVDPDRLVAFGISLGGIMTTVLAAAEPRLHSSVICLAGGDLAKVFRVSEEGRLIRFWEAKKTELGLEPDALEEHIRQAMPSDPLRMAPALDPTKVFIVTARFDPIIPLVNQERLWEAMGEPVRYDIPSGHYSGIFYLPFITAQAVDWLQQRLGTRGQLPVDTARVRVDTD